MGAEGCVDCSDSSLNPTMLALLGVSGAVFLAIAAMAIYACFYVEPESLQVVAGQLTGEDLAAAERRIREGAASVKKVSMQIWKRVQSEGFDALGGHLTKFMGLTKIVVGFGQIVGTFSVTFTVPWPSELLSLFESLDVFNLDVFQAVNIDCIGQSYTFYDTFIITITYPLIILALIWIVKWARHCCVKEGEEKERKQQKISVQHWKATLFCAFLVYPSVSSTVLKLYSFNPYLADKYLMADYRLPMDETWTKHALIGIPCLFLYPIGIPLFFFYFLYRYRQIIHDDSLGERRDLALAKIGFISESYTEEAWFWEVVLILQKVLLTGVIIFFHPGTTIQLALAFMIAFFFMLCHDAVRPYIDDGEEDLQRYANISIVLTLFGGIMYKTNSDGETEFGKFVLKMLLVCVNVGVVSLFILQCTAKPGTTGARRVAEKRIRKAINQIKTRDQWQAEADWQEHVTMRLLRGMETALHDFLFDDTEDEEGNLIMDEAKLKRVLKLVSEVASNAASDPEHTLDWVWLLASEVMDVRTSIPELLSNAVPRDVIQILRETPEHVKKEEGSEEEEEEPLVALVEITLNHLATTDDPGNDSFYFAHPETAQNHRSRHDTLTVVEEGGMTSAGSPLASGGGAGFKLDAAQLQKAREIFVRYDLDDSGTCNSWQEVQQMTMNILFTLEVSGVFLKISPERVDELVLPLKSTVEEEPLAFEAYIDFFNRAIGGELAAIEKAKAAGVKPA